MMTQSNLTFTENHEIPEGYKKTEVGFIPENWNVVPLMHISEKIMVGIASSATHAYRNKGIPLLRNQNIKSNKLDDDDIIYISEDYEKGFFNKRLKEGDLLTARTGYPGTTCLVPKIFENAQSFTTLITRLKSDSENPIYLSYFINSEKGQKFFTDNQIGGGQKNVNAATLKRFPVIVPPLNEQQKIATALSDTDALISELEKLIEKKQAIKTATMQQLLTGKTRLSEFALREDGTPKVYKESELGQIPEDWEVIEFQNLLETTILKRKLDKNSEVTFISMQDVSEKAELKHQQTLAYENIKIGLTYFERNDTLVAKITPCFENGKGCFTDQLDTAVGFGSTEFHVLRSNSNTYPKFIYYWTLTGKFRKSLEKEMVGSAGHRRVPLKEIQKFKIQSSLNKDEQRLISKKISDAESELKVLEAKLEKIRKIKLGMMQELLTGKTRLV